MLIVTKPDRLARSTSDLLALVKQLEAKVSHAENWLARVYQEVDTKFFKQKRSENQRAAS